MAIQDQPSSTPETRKTDITASLVTAIIGCVLGTGLGYKLHDFKPQISTPSPMQQPNATIQGRNEDGTVFNLIKQPDGSYSFPKDRMVGAPSKP